MGRPASFALLLGVWLVPAAVSSVETYAMMQLAGRGIPFWRAMAAQTPQWLMYGVLSPLILHMAERLPLHRAPRLAKLIAHGTVALALGIPYALAATASYRAVMPPSPSNMGFTGMALSWYLSALPIMLLTYFAVAGAGTAVHWFVRHRDAELRSAKLETQLTDARLAALRSQLHPHFLFNSLNAITVLIRDRDHDTAERMLELLSELLRSTLRATTEHRIPVADEVAFIRRYLAIEEIRFSDRLRVNYDIDPAVDQALVPALVLQPLVENAIRHGISRSRTASRIAVAARTQNNRLILEVVDDGPGPAATSMQTQERSRGKSGVGLANTRDRLAVLYGDASCELRPGVNGGTIARIEIPLELAAHAEQLVKV